MIYNQHEPAAHGCSDDERAARLNRVVIGQQSQGATLVASDGTMAVLATGKPVNHILHLILSVLTLGIWLLVWILLAMTGGEKRYVLRVDDAGVVRRTKT